MYLVHAARHTQASEVAAKLHIATLNRGKTRRPVSSSFLSLRIPHTCRSVWLSILQVQVQMARVRSPVPAGPTISVVFCNPALGARSQALRLRLYIG
jgi:hypothetical protein